MQAQFHNLITFALMSFILAGILALPLISILYRFKVVRKIDVDFSTLIEDRKQKYGTPIMGGLIFILAIIIINLLFNLNVFTRIPLMLFSMAALLGAADDLLNIFGEPRHFKSISRILTLIKVHKNWWQRFKLIVLFPWYVFVSIMHIFESNPGTGLRAHEKLIIQGLIGGVLGIWIFKLYGGLFWMPFLGTFDIGLWIVPFAAITFMGVINSVNISDGMDGLASGMGVISLVTLTMVAYLGNLFSTSLFAISAAGALITYLYFNVKPARIQMGDTGSFALGALITILAFSIGKPFLLCIAAFPFLVELLSTIVQAISRRIFGRRILQMAPLHHHFEMLGWSEDKVVVRFWLISLVFGFVALWLSFF